MKRVEIIAVGREILRGQTLDTNSHWLARRVTALGGEVIRISVPDDRPEAIAKEVLRALEDGADVVITTGGMGPTFDDRTLEGVAQAFGLPLETHPWALEFVKGKYREFHRKGFVEAPDLTPEREKMARLPFGAEPFPNPVGAAPGVMVKERGAVVFCLPGVPREMRPMFDQEVLPRLREVLGSGVYVEEEVETHVGDESVLAQVVERVMKKVPGVYLKSKPTRFGADVRLKVVLSAAGEDQAEVRGRLSKAKDLLLEALQASH